MREKERERMRGKERKKERERERERERESLVPSLHSRPRVNPRSLQEGESINAFFVCLYCGLYRVNPHIILYNLPLLRLAVNGVINTKS